MRHDTLGASGLNYAPCRYGHSRLSFRGPRKSTEHSYIACLGGTATYGKYVETPFPQILERETGQTCLNLGVQNAGVDAFEGDPALVALCQRADAVVLQVCHVQNLSNRFYRVHPRRNDRFLEASSVLKALFPEVDFSEFDFTRHMLGHLAQVAPDKFEIVQIEVQEAWIARMRSLLKKLGRETILMRVTPLGEEVGGMSVSDAMLAHVSEYVDTVFDYVPSQVAIETGTSGMVFPLLQRDAVRQHLNKAMHLEIAETLEPLIRERTPKKKARTLFARASA